MSLHVPKWRIRAGTRTDQPALLNLVQSAIEAYGYEEEIVRKLIGAMSADPRLVFEQSVLLAENDSTIIGGLILKPLPVLALMFLDGLFVAPAEQRKGVGGTLLQAAIEKARRSAAVALLIYSHPSAVGFYERRGAVKVAETPLPGYLPDTVALTLMTLAIGPG